MNFVKKSKNIIFTAFAVVFVLYGSFLSIGRICSKFIDTKEIENYINKQTDLVFELKDIRLYSTKDIGFEVSIENLSIATPDKTKKILDIEKGALKIKFLPLIFKQIHLKKISASSIKANIIRDKNGVFEVEKYLNKNINADFEVLFKKANLDIKNYEIKFEDNLYSLNNKIQGKNLLGLELSDKNINLKTQGEICLANNKSNFYIDINTKIPVEKSIDKDFLFDIKLHNFNLKTIEPYLKPYNIQKAQGIFNVDISTLKNQNKNEILFASRIQNLHLNNGKSDIQNKNTMVVKSNIFFEKDILNFRNLAILSNKINLTGEGNVKNYLSKNPLFDMSFNIKDSQLYDLIALVPDEIPTKEDSIRKLKLYNAHSIMNGNVSIKGDSLKPMINGRIDFKEIWVLKENKNIPVADGFANLNGDYVSIDITAYAAKNQWVKIVGDAEFYGRMSGKFRITSADEVNLEVAHTILIPVRDVVGFVLGPLPIMKIKGIGSIDILTEGTTNDALIEGWFKFKNTEATIEGLGDNWLKKASGLLLFEKEDMIFDNWQALIENNPITISGKADVKGNVDLNFVIKKGNFSELVKIASRTDFAQLIDKKLLPKKASGNADFTLKLKGQLKEFDKDAIFTHLKPYGFLNFYNCALNIENAFINRLNGEVKFGEKYSTNLEGNLGYTPFSIKALLTPKNKEILKANINLASSKISSNDIFKLVFDKKIANKLINKIHFGLSSYIDITGEIPYDLTKFDLNKFNLNGEIKGIQNKQNNLKLTSGKILLKGKNAIFENLNINFQNSNIKLNGPVTILSKKIKPNLKIQLNNFELYSLIDIIKIIENKTINNVIADFSNIKGYFKGIVDINGDNFKGKIEPYKISVYSNSKNANCTLESGHFEFNNETLKLKAFNFNLDKIPFYADAIITNFATKKPYFNAKFSTLIDEKGIDKFINPMLDFPIRAQGEISLNGKISGHTDKYNTNATMILNPNSDIFYMGANFGDIENKREVKANISFIKNNAKIHRIEYLKYILSQNNKINPLSMFRMSGNINKKADGFTFEPIIIKTINPISAKFFNICFKKSILKQGLFNCDIKITGDLKNPKIVGKLGFNNVNIPLYDLKILNADFDIQKENIIGLFDGKSFDSDVKINLIAQNKTTLPVILEKVDVSSMTINLTRLIDEIAKIVQDYQKNENQITQNPIMVSPNMVLIKNGTIKAKEIKLRDLNASNFSANFNKNEDDKLNIENVKLDIANGEMIAKGNIDLNKIKVSLDSEIKNCDANILASGFLGANNQIYGTMNGKLVFEGEKIYSKEGLSSIISKINFEILNGRMPKLGSLEYLLRAANFYKSGILGLSLNNLIEILIPYKTGEFETIKGNLSIKDGMADTIEIYSKGKNLSVFIQGNYNLINQEAEIMVFGRLAKNVSNALGTLGNASFNTIINAFTPNKDSKTAKNDLIQIINKIPLIEISNDDFRIFQAKIFGNINNDNYVKSFNWLN